jgi:hypothetical protein
MQPVDSFQKHTEKNTININGAEAADLQVPKSEREPCQGNIKKR